MVRTGLGRFGVLVIAAVALVVSATIVINPYGVWPNIFGNILPLKTARVNSVRLVKAYDLFKSCPDHVITGMSTVVWGINPDNYPVANKVLYNGGIVGSSIIEQYNYIMRYIKLCPSIKKVYLDANYSSFLNYRINSKDFSMDRMERNIPLPADVLFATFAKSALVASYHTVSDQMTGIANAMVFDKENGFHRIPEASHDVYYNNFIRLLDGAYHSNTRLSPMQLSYFKQLVTELRGRGIETVVYMGPTHPFLHYMGKFDGSKPEYNSENQYDDLKRKLVDITDLWDFNQYNKILGEDIAKTDYFIDYIHYRPRLGEAMLAVINGQRRPNFPDNFGILVTKANVEQDIADFHRGMDQWALDYPQYAKLISDHFAHAPTGSLPQFELRW